MSMTDADKDELQRQADDPNSPVNRDPVARANKMIKAAMETMSTRQWCVQKAVEAGGGPETVSLARQIYAFVIGADRN